MNFPTVHFTVRFDDGSEVKGTSRPFDAVLIEKRFDAPMVELMPGDGSSGNQEALFYWAYLVTKRARRPEMNDVEYGDEWAETVVDFELDVQGSEDSVPLGSAEGQS